MGQRGLSAEWVMPGGGKTLETEEIMPTANTAGRFSKASATIVFTVEQGGLLRPQEHW